jgi:hypothetical protein
MAALTSDEKAALNSIRILFGKTFSEVRELFESIGVQAVLNYTKGEKIVIPFIGEIKISYDGEEMTEKGRVAKLKTNFTPSPFLVRNAGQVQDEESTDAEKILMSRFRAVFKERIKE